MFLQFWLFFHEPHCTKDKGWTRFRRPSARLSKPLPYVVNKRVESGFTFKTVLAIVSSPKTTISSSCRTHEGMAFKIAWVTCLKLLAQIKQFTSDVCVHPLPTPWIPRCRTVDRYIFNWESLLIFFPDYEFLPFDASHLLIKFIIFFIIKHNAVSIHCEICLRFE